MIEAALLPAMPPAYTSAPVDAPVFVATVTDTPSRRRFDTAAPLPSSANSPPCATAVVVLRLMSRLDILNVRPWKMPVYAVAVVEPAVAPMGSHPAPLS